MENPYLDGRIRISLTEGHAFVTSIAIAEYSGLQHSYIKGSILDALLEFDLESSLNEIMYSQEVGREGWYILSKTGVFLLHGRNEDKKYNTKLEKIFRSMLELETQEKLKWMNKH